MASVGTVDAKGLEGRQEGEPTAPRSRDFFWDSVVLFVVTAIVALTAIDVVAEFIRGADVRCFLPNDTSRLEAVEDYVNELCAGSLPRTEYLPAYIAIHAILILAPHYLWLNMFGANLDFFFQHVSQLVRTRDEKTGEYAKLNYVISKQLEDAFTSSYKSNWMYRLYLLKLVLQLLISAIGFIIVVWLFTDFDESFICPTQSSDTRKSNWPLPDEQVMCVFTSLHLLGQINLIYLTLLALAIVCLFGAIIWCVTLHISELGTENLASFTFQSSIPLNYYIPQLPISKLRCFRGLGDIAYGLLSYLPYYSLHSPYKIQSDYDFLVIKLFRTDGGLAHILREVHALRLLKEKNNEEYARINILRRQLPYEGKKVLAEPEFLMGDIGWELPKWEQKHDQLPSDELLAVPGNVRGAVLGLAARCLGSIVHKNKDDPRIEEGRSLSGALCVCFDSESLGFAGALSQVFRRVGIINFSPYYMDYEDPVKIDINNDSRLVIITCPHDILTSGKKIKEREDSDNEKEPRDKKEKADNRFFEYIVEVWRPGFLAARKRDAVRRAKWDAEQQKKTEEREARKKAAAESKYKQPLRLKNEEKGDNEEEEDGDEEEEEEDEEEETEDSSSEAESFVYKANEIEVVQTDYIVIAPISKSNHLQVATVNILLERTHRFLSNSALILTMLPKVIGGKTVKKLFHSYTPPNFSKVTQQTQILPPPPPNPQHPSTPLKWPPTEAQAQPEHRETVTAGRTDCVFDFTLYERREQETNP